MVSKIKAEDRRFQIELVRTEVDLENIMALIIGTIALEFAVFVYYGQIGEKTLQFIAAILLILTIYAVFPTVYLGLRKRRFKALEEQFITKKKKES